MYQIKLANCRRVYPMSRLEFRKTFIASYFVIENVEYVLSVA